ncbi:chemotaxis protein CheW [Methylobacterium sp. R2-1]|uniref:chemotaxis protein CheW n=1 Tax=Methylobacterium sp. R2-1 TaxID=2587064 RepID=UPI00161704E9|nr:chemotaxis protein CheW [Methylobacterium sp. R2-1]MBB2960116.1 purine-binding chemotaxis protein CheW [Methylobacterium sp. R2-1]
MKIGLTAGADPKTRNAALLDARAAALAARRAGQDETVETAAYLVCACGAERYGLPLAAVAGVTPERPCTGLPGAPPALKGITAVAGAIVSVLDLAACLGLDHAGEDDGGHVVHLRAQEPPVALAVDRVLGIARIEAALARQTKEPESLGRGPLSGYAPPGSDRTGDIREGFSLVDLPALLARFTT